MGAYIEGLSNSIISIRVLNDLREVVVEAAYNLLLVCLVSSLLDDLVDNAQAKLVLRDFT